MSGSRLLPFTVTICGIEELDSHCAAGVSHVLSILDPDFPEPEAFGSYGEHARLELRFHDVIHEVAGQQAPQPHHVDQLLAFGREMMREPGVAHLLVHCHAGISRSTAATTLLLAQALRDTSAEAVMAEVARIRPRAWPNLRMIEFGDEQLGRGGALVRAVRARHREMAQANPLVAEFMVQAGRGREVDGS